MEVAGGLHSCLIAPALLRPKRIATNTTPNSLPSTRNTNAVSHTRLQTYDQLPLAFEANRGQADPQVDFLSRGRGYTLALSPTEIGLSLVLPQFAKQLPPGSASFSASMPVAIAQAGSKIKLHADEVHSCQSASCKRHNGGNVVQDQLFYWEQSSAMDE